jgi:hypothetical protein
MAIEFRDMDWKGMEMAWHGMEMENHVNVMDMG